MTLVIRLSLFASSFTIALLLIAVRVWDRDRGLALAVLGLAVILVLPAIAIHWYAKAGAVSPRMLSTSIRAASS